MMAMAWPALVVGLFSFILSMSIVRTFALQHEYHTDSNQELIALGLANLLGAFFGSYPISGSLSRSALVSSTCGATCTPMHGVFTAMLVLVVLLLLTPTVRPMPKAVLASIVFMAVRPLFSIQKPRFLYRVKPFDFVTWCSAFLATLLAGVQVGIGVGILTSLVLLILRDAIPNHAVLGQLPTTNIFRDIRRYPEANQLPGLVAFRFDAPLNFVNKDTFSAALRAAIDNARARSPEALSVVIVDFGAISDVDASALRTLEDLLKELQEGQLRLLLAGCKGPVRDVFDRSGFLEIIQVPLT